MSENKFSVWIFFPDETHIAEIQWVDSETAVKTVKNIINRPAALIGIINRIIITDGDDFIALEWIYGKGITFPPSNQLKL